MADRLDIEKTMEITPEGQTGKASLSPGSALGQYRIIRLLGRGGMGEVYEVEHKVLGRRYALKLLPADFAARSDALARFEREARVMANLEHPNIVRVDEFGEVPSTGSGQADGRYWLRMELVEGIRSTELGTRSEKKKVYATDKGRPATDKCIVSLQDYVESRGGKIPQEELLEILKQILAGLDYAHKRGAIHRDLKPSNILLSGEEGTADERRFTPIVKISDFGLVKLVGEEWVRSQAQVSVQRSLSMGARETMRGKDEGTSTRALLGTYEYMSPEQKRGEEADERSDIYSLGLMTFRLLTGRQSLEFELPNQIDGKLAKEWDAFVLNSVRSGREERFNGVSDMRDALEMVSNVLTPEHERRPEAQKTEVDKKAKKSEQRHDLTLPSFAVVPHTGWTQRLTVVIWSIVLLVSATISVSSGILKVRGRSYVLRHEARSAFSEVTKESLWQAASDVWLTKAQLACQRVGFAARMLEWSEAFLPAKIRGEILTRRLNVCDVFLQSPR